MQILFEHKNTVFPKVSVILLDWSCRESFHILDYLARQTMPRDQYEIIWVEYYSKRPPEIEAKLKECRKMGVSPAIDQWIVLEMPEDVYYHKHLMYNIGILASRGEIVVLCDSDAMVKPTFIESIIKTFEQDSNAVLHLDEVRNTDKRFHPFSFPSFEEITGKGCINWKNGKTTGVLDREDPLHIRNYGSCMCALKTDIVRIGGADEHEDYLGHICGPYELTFRLVNAGKKEVWHQEEFLYHAWHPGTNGRNNYLGPHDGSNMSTTALKIRRSGRVMPLVENPAIKIFRSGDGACSQAFLLSQAVSGFEIKRWKINGLKRVFSESLSILKRIGRKMAKIMKLKRIP